MSWHNVAIILLGLAIVSLPHFVPQLADVDWFDMVGGFLIGAAGVKRLGDVKAQPEERLAP